MTNKDRIAAYVSASGSAMTPTQIAEALGMPRSSVGRACNELAWECRIRTDGKGRYMAKSGKNE